jgi:nucleoid-associated protein YgaU
MDAFDQLKLKYQSVLNLITQKGVSLKHLHVEGGKLFLQGAAPNEDVKNDIWNQIKLVDGNWAADLICDLSVDSSLPQPAAEPKTYTVVAGDSLWKIAANQLGNGSRYPEIIKANPGKLKDEKSVIHPGDVLVLPE